MRRLVLIPFLLVCLGVADRAVGHGFRIDIDGDNKLVLHSDDPTANGGLIYKVPALLGPPNSRSNDEPGYDVDDLNGPSGFSGGESIGFDAMGPLWYSDGNMTTPSPDGVDIVITAQDLSVTEPVTVTGISGLQSGFLIGVYDGAALGAYEHQLNYQIDVPGGVPVGAYSLGLRLTGTNAASQPFTPSERFAAIFNNGLDATTFATVADSLAAHALEIPGDVNFDGVVSIFDINLVSSNWNMAGPVADANGDHTVNIFDVNLISSHWGDSIYGGSGAMTVPEPSGIVLAALAGVGMIAFRHRRSRRRALSPDLGFTREKPREFAAN
jgi:Dockerin type I domain